MRYQVVLIKSDEGFAVHCPALPACWSQGSTQEEALANITAAISEYLDYVASESDARRELMVREARKEGCQVQVCEVQVLV